MKKIFTKSLATLAVVTTMTTNLQASKIDMLTIDAGVSSLNISGASDNRTGSSTESGTYIGIELSLSKSKGSPNDFYLGYGYNMYDKMNFATYGMGYRYNIAPKIYIGGSFGISALGSDEVSTFTGVTYGLETKYKFTSNHGILLKYTTGTLSDETALVKIDASTTVLSYSFSF